VATDPVTGRTIQRSFTFRGGRVEAQARCAELASEYAALRVLVRSSPFLTVHEVLERWLGAHHEWRPSTAGVLRKQRRRPFP
jgi:hypothetical protein